MDDRSSLLTVIAHARSGALDYAWRLLCEAGLDRVNDDPAVLSVLGRLLKDGALRAEGEKRQGLYQEAAAAYSRASELSGTTYPLINAATLSLLAGRRDQAKVLARQVLAQTEVEAEGLETPYYRAATRAEALLLLGDIPQAKTVFAEAISKAPKAFEDHASTLRQFALILDEMHEDKSWLDSYRPPRCLHYAGHMGIGLQTEVAEQRIRAIMSEERIGFGFGALAAGADILVAEALLERGAELHLLLPAAPKVFREISVIPFGSHWETRFDRVLEAADSIRQVGPGSDPSSSPALQLGAEVAMGRAVMQANVLMTEAIQLVVLDQSAPVEGEAGMSQWISTAWGKVGRRQHVVNAPRVQAEPYPVVRSSVSAADCLAAILRVTWSEVDANLGADQVVLRLAQVVNSGPTTLTAPRWTDDALNLTFRNPADAARAAIAVVAVFSGDVDFSVAGHYGLVSRGIDPFSGTSVLFGPATTMLRHVVASTPPGAIHVTEDFAAALYAGPIHGRSMTEYVGDLPTQNGHNPVRLFALRPNTR